jgi:hypothetical protein
LTSATVISVSLAKAPGLGLCKLPSTLLYSSIPFSYYEMSRYEDLTRRFLAAGDVEHSDGTVDLFYEEENELILKPWTGEEFGETEFVTDQVREKTPVAGLILPSGPNEVSWLQTTLNRNLQYSD